MTSYLFIILGVCVVCLADYYMPPIEPGSDRERCFNMSNTQNIAFGKCLERKVELSPDENLEELYSGSPCPQCQHICSKLSELQECRRQFSSGVGSFNDSPKALNFTQFADDIFEDGLSFLCQNDTEMFSVYNDGENGGYLLRKLTECSPLMLFYLNPIIYCDIEQSSDNIERGLCLSFIHAAMCVGRAVKEDKPELVHFMSTLYNATINSRACGERLKESLTIKTH